MNRYLFLLMILGCFIGEGAAADQHPIPSFEKDSQWSRRNSETDLNLDLYHRSWKDSPVVIGHGGFQEQAILERGNPMNPPAIGKCLICLTEYNHGFLPADTTTTPVTNTRRQTFFFVLKGDGKAYCGDDTIRINEGSGIFMPAGLTYHFENTGGRPLEVLIISEDITTKFEPAKAMSFGNYRESVPGSGQAWHWSHVTRGVLSPKWENPISFGVVTIDAFEIAHPHVAPIGIEEIWLQLTGKSLMYFGNRLFRHEAGEAFYIPPNYMVPHCSINPADEPMTWMYLGIRLDRDIPVTPEMQKTIDSLTMEE